MGRRKPGLSPDKQLEIRLNGHAGFLAARLDLLESVLELHELGDGRDDLVAIALAHKLGGWVGTAMNNPSDLIAAGLLAHCKYDFDVFVTEFDAVRLRVAKPGHGGR